MTPDVNVVLLDFPTSGNEMVFENEDGSYTIMINSRLSCDGQLKAYRHAMHHIENDDFSKRKRTNYRSCRARCYYNSCRDSTDVR